MKVDQARIARLMAANLDTVDVARIVGMPHFALLRWVATPKFQKMLYAALIAHCSVEEACMITARRAKGLLPPPLADEWLAEDADLDTA